MIFVVVYPAPIKPLIRTWIKSSNYPLSANAKNHGDYVIYSGDANEASQTTVPTRASSDSTSSPSDYSASDGVAVNDGSSSSSRSVINNEEQPSGGSSNDRETLITSLQAHDTNNTHTRVLASNSANLVLNERNAISGENSTATVASSIYDARDTPSSTDKRKNVIVFFIGGSFLFQDLTSHYGIGNKLYELMGPKNFDVMLVRYPVRFGSTLQQSMLSINKTLSEIILKYKEFYAIGYSAGALLASVFIQKELDIDYSSKIKVPQIGLTFRKLIGICGLYYPVFVNNAILTRLFRFYILRSTVSPSMYTVTSALESIPKLVISNTTDFLYAQTAKFIQTIPNTAYKIYTNTQLNHTFIENVDLVESQDAFVLMQKFILQATN